MNYKKTLACLAVAVSFTGCTTIADLAGADSATLNLQATQSYNAMLKDAQSKQVLDTKSATYQKVNRVFLKMKPFADQMNQTGQAFDLKVAVIKSKEINAYVAPGG